MIRLVVASVAVGILLALVVTGALWEHPHDSDRIVLVER